VAGLLTLMLCLPAAAAATASPLPESDYATRPLCAPPTPGRATCLATELVPLTAAARARTHPLGLTTGPTASPSLATGAYGLSPNDLRSAYFPGERPEAPVGEPQTIALVDAYDDPEAETDLRVYSEAFGLPQLPPCQDGAVSACFEKVNQSGETGNPPVPGDEQESEEASRWAGETSIDIEVAHGICRNCRILLVEASAAHGLALEAAEKTAERLGATEISNSWTGGDEDEPIGSPFHHPGIVITAGAGDWGYLNWAEDNEYETGVNYPAASPGVIAVGGTKLTLTATGARASETVWNEDVSKEKDATGGGCSELASAPPWQTAVPDWAAVGCGTGEQARRAVADVAVDADPSTGVAIYDSVPYYVEPGFAVAPGWVTIGGTSLSSPIVAAMFALVGGAHEVEFPAATLYSHLGGSSLYDVTAGGDGKCDGLYTSGCEGSLSPLSPLDCGAGVLICNAGPGYDGPSGVGAPAGLAAFEVGSEAGHAERVAIREVAAKQAEAERQAAEKKAAEERKAEEERLAAERRPAEERAAAERHAAEQKAAAERKAAESLAAEQKVEAERTAAAARRATEAKAQAEQKVGEAARAAELRAEAERQAKQAELELRNAIEADGLAGNDKGGKSADGPIHLSGLALTARASAAITRGLPTLSQIAFTFDLNRPARVRATLSRLLTAHGPTRSVPVASTLTLTAARGRDRAHLQGHTTLSAGSYRLTLTPPAGAARSIVLVLRAPTHPPAAG
jgi:Subtilase family